MQGYVGMQYAKFTLLSGISYREKEVWLVAV